MTYNEYISQFPVYNSPKNRKGLHRHHIVPQSQQMELDERCVYLTPAQHFWAHILYDRENGTQTSNRFLSCSNIQPQCYEDCLPYNQIDKKIREKHSEFQKGNQYALGQRHSEEWKKRMSNSLKGENSFWYGKSFSEEHKRNLSKSHINNPNYLKHQKPVRQYTLDGQFVKKYPSAKSAQLETGIRHIDAVCRGERKSAGSFLWEYS